MQTCLCTKVDAALDIALLQAVIVGVRALTRGSTPKQQGCSHSHTEPSSATLHHPNEKEKKENEKRCSITLKNNKNTQKKTETQEEASQSIGG